MLSHDYDPITQNRLYFSPFSLVVFHLKYYDRNKHVEDLIRFFYCREKLSKSIHVFDLHKKPRITVINVFINVDTSKFV